MVQDLSLLASFSSRYSVGSFDFYIILSLDFNMLLTFSFDPRFHCQLLLLQRYRFSNYFFENCPLSSVPFPLFRINDHLYYFHGF